MRAFDPPDAGSTIPLLRVSGVQAVLLASYLGVAPVRWLPGVDSAMLRSGKLALCAAAVGLVVAAGVLGSRARAFRLPAGIGGPLAFAALAALSVPGLLQTPQWHRVLQFLLDIVYGAAFLWCFYNVARADQRMAQRILAGAAALFALFAAAALAAHLLGMSLRAPCGIGFFRETGFSCNRTSWSLVAAAYAGVPLAFALRRDLAGGWRIGYASLAALFAAVSALSGGRGGMVALAVSSAAVILVVLPRQAKLAALCAALLAAAGIAQGMVSEEVLRFLRMDRLTGQELSLEAWNQFSAGRVGQMLAAWDVIAERPFSGVGIGVLMVFYREVGSHEVHNLWLGWASASGVQAPLLFAALTGVLLLRAWQLARRNSPLRQGAAPAPQSTAAACGAILLAGLGGSMFEGTVPLGEFQDSAIWWAAAGIVLGIAAPRPAAS